MTPSAISPALMWIIIAVTVTAITIIGASIRGLIARRPRLRKLPVPQRNERELR